MDFTLTHGPDDRKPDDDPGNLYDRIDTDDRVRLTTEHRSFDGSPHATPDAFERFEADRLPVAVWRGCGR